MAGLAKCPIEDNLRLAEPPGIHSEDLGNTASASKTRTEVHTEQPRLEHNRSAFPHIGMAILESADVKWVVYDKWVVYAR
jgi:hypothetical protein